MPERDSIFRIRKGDVRTNRPQLPSRGGQRQPGWEVQASAGRNDRPGDFQGRRPTPGGSGLSNETAEALRLVAESFGVREGDAFTTLTVLDWYHARGLYIVPAKFREKMPSIPWRELAQEEAAPRPNYTFNWFGEQDPGEINYAVLCGKPSGGLVIVDFDDLEKGQEFSLPTFTVGTGKGLHYYLRVTDGDIPNRIFPMAHFDIRGQGGIAVVPPSVHPTGRVYYIAHDLPIAEVTQAQLSTYLERVLGHDPFAGEGEANEPGWFEEAFGAVCTQGSRNDTCARLAGRLIGAGLSATEVVSVLLVWADSRTEPRMSNHEILATVQSIGRKHRETLQAKQPTRQPEPDTILTPGYFARRDDDNDVGDDGEGI